MIEYIEIAKLKPYDKNPRKISKRDLKKLAESIQNNPEYFCARPIITDANLTIYAGNQRYKAAKEIGLEKVPVIVLNLPKDKMLEIMFRDNISAGDWNEALLSDYDFSFLEDVGLKINFNDISELDENEQESKDEKKKKNKTKKVITCPHCNNDFEI